MKEKIKHFYNQLKRNSSLDFALINTFIAGYCAYKTIDSAVNNEPVWATLFGLGAIINTVLGTINFKNARNYTRQK